MTTPETRFLAKSRLDAVVIAGAVIALLACVAGPWELGRSARRAQHREACEAMRSWTQGLSDGMRSMAASLRGLEQEDRRLAATWGAMGAGVPMPHSAADGKLLQIDASIAASNERSAEQEKQFAMEADQYAADVDGMVASRCEGDGLRSLRTAA